MTPTMMHPERLERISEIKKSSSLSYRKLTSDRILLRLLIEPMFIKLGLRNSVNTS